jgi:hypothetical protein
MKNIGGDQGTGLPKLTGLQFLVLSAIADGNEMAGRDMREWLADFGVKSSGPQFYQMMARLEDGEYVEGRYAQKDIDHQVVNERRYIITPKGSSAWGETRAFYSNLGHPRPSRPEAKSGSVKKAKPSKGAAGRRQGRKPAEV